MALTLDDMLDTTWDNERSGFEMAINKAFLGLIAAKLNPCLMHESLEAEAERLRQEAARRQQMIDRLRN